jgi:acetyl/propionyl-CoA carboxylase alpha subunit
MDREFTLSVNGREHQIEIHGNSVLVDGQPFVIGVENGVLTVDGIVYEVSLDEGSAVVDGQEYQIQAAGMAVRAAAPRKAPARKKQAAAGADAVTAMMPGAILRVLVDEGDEVQSGDVVVILEAMKMENEIHAHKSGVVTRVHVAPGDSVENDQALVEIG